MTRKEIERNRQTLRRILTQEDAGKRLEELQRLAKQVGASITKIVKLQTRHDAATVGYTDSNEITESEIVHNIQEALRTETMIHMCNVSAKNYRIALAATLIALLAMLASWVPVFVKVGWSK